MLHLIRFCCILGFLKTVGFAASSPMFPGITLENIPADKVHLYDAPVVLKLRGTTAQGYAIALKKEYWVYAELYFNGVPVARSRQGKLWGRYYFSYPLFEQKVLNRKPARFFFSQTKPPKTFAISTNGLAHVELFKPSDLFLIHAEGRYTLKIFFQCFFSQGGTNNYTLGKFSPVYLTVVKN